MTNTPDLSARVRGNLDAAYTELNGLYEPGDSSHIETAALRIQAALAAMQEAEVAERGIRKGRLKVSLTDDAYEYNRELFTLEVTEMDGDDGIENDADVSGLAIGASQAEIAAYLSAAMACAEERAGPAMNVRCVASHAAQAGVKAVLAMRDKSLTTPTSPLPKFSHPVGVGEGYVGNDYLPVIGLSVRDTFIYDPKASECGRFPADPEKDYGISPEEVAQLAGLNEAIHEAAETALNAACLALQEKYGIESGDVAAHYFSGQTLEDFKRDTMNALTRYMLFEIRMAEHNCETEQATPKRSGTPGL